MEASNIFMSKRNFLLLIVGFVIIGIFAFSYFSSFKQSDNNKENQGGINFLSEFFPFGKKDVETPNNSEMPVDISGYIPPTTEDSIKRKIVRVSGMQVAGYGIFMKERFVEVPISTPIFQNDIKTENTIKPTPPATEFIPAVRYISRINGNIYQTFSDKINEYKITNTIIPQVYEAFLINNGESVVVRYLKEDSKTIETFVGSLPKEILGGDALGEDELIGSFLPENITDLSISNDTLKMFYLFKTNESVSGFTADSFGNKKSQIFSSPFTEWLSYYPNNKIITLTTKPSSDVYGYTYSIDLNNKNFTKVLGDIKGLTTTTSPSGDVILFSDNNLTLKFFNINKKEFTPIKIKTLPEKCTWNKSSTIVYCAVPKYIDSRNLPDNWYQGETSFNDEFWKIDVLTGNSTKIIDPAPFVNKEDIDGIKLSVDVDENFLFFVNKNNPYLWEIELK
jgi:hypothetical protein